MDDVKLEILLSAKNASEAAFRDVKAQLGSLQQELTRTAKAAESSFDLSKFKAAALGAAAAVYSAYRAMGQAIDLAEQGSKLERQAAAFENLAEAAGTSSRRILEDLKRSSRGMVSEVDLMAASGKALLMNIPAREISKLMEIAAATSRSTGQTITEAFNDITLGVARQSRMILDNLGIIVNVDQANADYARALGKTAAALTDAEKRQAFMNAVLKSGEDMVRRIGTAQGELEGVNRLLAAQSDLWGEIAKTVAAALDKEFASLARFVTWLGDKLKAMRSEAADSSRQALRQEIEMLRALEAKGMAFPGSADRKEEEYNRRYLTPQLGLKESEERKKRGSWSTPAWDSARFRAQEGTWPEMTDAEKKAAIDARDKFLREQADAAKRTMEQLAAEVKKYSEEFNEALMGQSRLEEYTSGGRSGNAILRMEQERVARIREEAAKLYGADGDYITRHREEIGPYEAERTKRTLDAIARQGEESMGEWVQLSERTAEAMETNFSDLFFDAFTGKLKSAEDYFRAFSDSIARMAADLAGQMAKTALFGASPGQSLGGLFGLLFGGGSSTMDQSTALALVKHAGGDVDGGGARRTLPAWMIASAPRLHGGLYPGEYPAIRQRGETVLPRGAGGVSVTVNNHSTERATVKESRGPDGRRQVMVTIGQDIAAGGPIARSIEQTYGLRRAGRLG